MKQIIENCIDFVKNYFKNDSSGHDYYHTMRVHTIAKQIAEKEKADVNIVMLSALLHDVDDIKISPSTNANKDNARRFLVDNKVDEKTIEIICNIINEVSYKGVETTPSITLEGRIVQDADRLDALGAIGIARAFAYGGNKNRKMYDPNEKPKLNMTENEYRNHISTTINHFYEKLFNLKDIMNTETAKKMALEREEYMKEFVKKFLTEWNGII